MHDIITELKKWADAPIKSPAISKALREAANEIERLREQTLQLNTNIERSPQKTPPENIVTRLLALNHPDAADAADEIERLQALIHEMYPYLEMDINSGLSVGPNTDIHFHPDTDDPSYKCPDCKWYNESIAWLKRIQAGELGPQ